jgi:hypothetical protein
MTGEKVRETGVGLDVEQASGRPIMNRGSEHVFSRRAIGLKEITATKKRHTLSMTDGPWDGTGLYSRHPPFCHTDRNTW